METIRELNEMIEQLEQRKRYAILEYINNIGELFEKNLNKKVELITSYGYENGYIYGKEVDEIEFNLRVILDDRRSLEIYFDILTGIGHIYDYTINVDGNNGSEEDREVFINAFVSCENFIKENKESIKQLTVKAFGM